MFRSVVSLLFLALVSFTLCAQERRPTHRVQNDTNWFLQGSFGEFAKGVGDFDQDGFADYAVSAPDWPQGSFTGRVYLYSGRTAGVIQTFDGTQAGADFGLSLADVGDVDGDGTRDLAIGSPKYDDASMVGSIEHGRIQVFSGLTGTEIWSLSGMTAGDRFGTAMEAVGATLVVSEPGYSPMSTFEGGRIRFLDAASGTLLGDADGTFVFGAVGQTLAAAPDLSSVYATDANGRVFSVAIGAVTLEVTPPPGVSGAVEIALLGGVAGDVLAVAYQTADGNGLTNNGTVWLYPGGGGATPLAVIHGPRNGSFLGQSLGRGRDVDGDGLDEIIAIGAGPFFASPHEVSVFDQSGALVDFALRGAAGGSILTSIPDVTGDGRGEWINAIGTGSTTLFECAVFSLGLEGTESSAGSTTTWTFDIDAGPAHAGATYAQGYGLSGTAPGLALAAPAPLIPLNLDSAFSVIVSLYGTATLPDPVGVLDGVGQATTTLNLPTASLPSLVGVNVATAAVAFTGGAVTFASPPLVIEF